MKTMILLSDKELIEQVNRVLENRDEEYILVVTRNIVSSLRKLRRKKDIKIYLFKQDFSEEFSLKIFIHSSPDKILDCDPSNKLNALKKLISKTTLSIQLCSD